MLIMSLAGKSGPLTHATSWIYFRGPLRYDNIDLAIQLDQVVLRDLSIPRVEVSKDPQGLVSQSCLAGGYLNLFFSVNSIIDESLPPVNSRALLLGLAHFILGRLARLVDSIMSLDQIRPMSRNARLSLAALHVIVNRVKIFTSRSRHLGLFYVRIRSTFNP